MKTSLYSGEFIYKRIRNLTEEVAEIYKARSDMEDEYGKGSTVWRILDKSYQEKQKELDGYLVEKFETHEPKGFDF